MKSRLLKATMALGLLLIGLGVSVATAARVPVVGSSQKIGDLLRLINGSTVTTHTALPSQFLMLAPNNGKTPMLLNAYTACTDFSKMGSVSPSRAQDATGKSLTTDLTCYADDATMVTLIAATSSHVDALCAAYHKQLKAGKPLQKETPAARTARYNGMVNTAKTKLRKVLLYFVYKGYPVFLMDPWTSTLDMALKKFSVS